MSNDEHSHKMPRHEFTAEDQRNGGHARAAKIAEQKREDAEKVEAFWRERFDKMGGAVDEILAQRDDLATLLRAILAGHDRLVGKPAQHTEISGHIDHQHFAAEARETLASRLVEIPARSGTNGDSRGTDG